MRHNSKRKSRHRRPQPKLGEVSLPRADSKRPQPPKGWRGKVSQRFRGRRRVTTARSLERVAPHRRARSSWMGKWQARPPACVTPVATDKGGGARSRRSGRAPSGKAVPSQEAKSCLDQRDGSGSVSSQEGAPARVARGGGEGNGYKPKTPDGRPVRRCGSEWHRGQGLAARARIRAPCVKAASRWSSQPAAVTTRAPSGKHWSEGGTSRRICP